MTNPTRDRLERALRNMRYESNQGHGLQRMQTHHIQAIIKAIDPVVSSVEFQTIRALGDHNEST